MQLSKHGRRGIKSLTLVKRILHVEVGKDASFELG